MGMGSVPAISQPQRVLQCVHAPHVQSLGSPRERHSRLLPHGNQVRLGRFNHQVEMIWHEAIGMNLPARLAARLAQSLDKPLAVDVVAEDIFAPVPTIYDVVAGPWVLTPKFARHTVRQNPIRHSRYRAETDK